MSSIGDGISSDAVEQDASIAQIQAQQQGASAALQAGLPEVGFVASLNALVGLLTLQAGTSSTGVTVTVSSDGVATISISVTGIGGAGTAKTNSQVGAPSPSNDESEGYSIFSMWWDQTIPATPDFYICASAVTMTAVWVKLN